MVLGPAARFGASLLPLRAGIQVSGLSQRAPVRLWARSLAEWPRSGRREAIIVGVETSCDDTGVGILRVKLPEITQGKNQSPTSSTMDSADIASTKTLKMDANSNLSSHSKSKIDFSQEDTSNLTCSSDSSSLDLGAPNSEPAKIVETDSQSSASLNEDSKTARSIAQSSIGLSAEILANVVSSQFEIHQEYGGIVPTLAARAHQDNLPRVLQAALREAKLTWSDIDAVAVTSGPGLSPCLWAGINVASAQAVATNVPLIRVNHLEAHALVARLFEASPASFPFLTLIASGGHTLLVHVNGVRDYRVIGQSLDDAAGECFDKVARVLGCIGVNGHPGKEVEALASCGDANSVPFSVPLTRTPNVRSCDFSFSGLKASVRRHCMKLEAAGVLESRRADVAAGFQHAAFTHIENSTRRALVFSGCTMPEERWEDSSNAVRRKYEKEFLRRPDTPLADTPPTALVVSGGVAANQDLRRRLQDLAYTFGIPLYVPPPRLCTDNGVMIAWAGAELTAHDPETFLLSDPKEIEATSAIPRWPLDVVSQSAQS
mmetsp:Transcript_526/g.1317  ORF Transcript_526/g.1317 Transcript_526/m.1317 type:complete len:546 (-) Transcript_526:768-2405(-)